ncbi:VOC family protein [Nocardiopsis rhodophaea]|uniref:VOC family protein n=1 Tax=Nocardiopsis rhodophaea TaxID=280238 RepID=A0ABN2TFU7_9ACTN
MIKIALTSVYVTDQEKALAFYTNVLRLKKKVDFPVDGDRWLTVVSPADPDGVQLLLEPGGSRIAQEYQRAMMEAGIPMTSLGTDDIHAEYERMRDLGVHFIMEPTREGPVTQAVFDDTCGNLIGLHQED